MEIFNFNYPLYSYRTTLFPSGILCIGGKIFGGQMNWNLIKEKYPKAHKYLFDHCKVAIDIDKSRFLYDFFDEQGIYVIINRSPADNEFFWSIDIGKDFCDGDYTNTRTEAEEQAFLKAFEILEDKL